MTKSNKEKGDSHLKLILLIAGAALGLLLLLMGNLGDRQDTSEADAAFRYENLDPADYAREVEAQVATICSKVSGAGRAQAVVTLAGGYRAVFASDSQSGSSGYKSEVVLVGNGSAETAVLLGYENPEIEGIGIVCQGGDDPWVQKEIISLISATYHVSAARIYVMGGDVAQ